MAARDGTVSACIPAYQAAEFIDRTLGCARAQTHEAVRIVVSIDVSDDATEEICRAHAGEDDRVEVIAQPERLGWAGNVNFLLDRAGTEFAFLYFHDDLIEPEYCERLLAALRDRPDAASAHADMGHFGASETVVEGRAYDGSAAERLLDFLTSRRKPSLLRSMLRRELAGGVRLPTAGGGVWANQPFLLRLVAAGPAVHVPGVLYRRWEGREGGLTDGWRGLPFDEIVSGYRANAEVGLELIDDLDPGPDVRDVLIFGLMVHMTLRLRQAEARYGREAASPPELLLAEFAEIEAPPTMDAFPQRLREQCEAAWERLERRTARLATRR